MPSAFRESVYMLLLAEVNSTVELVACVKSRTLSDCHHVSCSELESSAACKLDITRSSDVLLCLSCKSYSTVLSTPTCLSEELV